MDSKSKELRDPPDSEIANNNFIMIYTTSRPFCLTVSGRHLGEMMLMHHQTAQVQGQSQQAAPPPFSVKQADWSQQQGGDQLRGGAPDRSGGLAVWLSLTSRPDSVALFDFKAQQCGQHREARQCSQHRRPSSLADFKA